MDEYQVRTWQGWHHHMALSLIAVWFLIGETHRGQRPPLPCPGGRPRRGARLLGGRGRARGGRPLPASPASIGIGRSLAAPPPTPPGIRVRTKAVRCGYLLW